MIVDVPGLPLRRRNGSVLYALIDPEDFVELNKWRWSLHANGYVARYESDGRTRVYVHRQVLGLERGDHRVGDHINGDKLDNRRANLRSLTHAENCQNQPGSARTSRHRNVSWDAARGKWRVKIFVAGQTIDGGSFDDEVAAAVEAARLRTLHMPFATERQVA